MSGNLTVRPLASWEPFTLRLDRDLLVLFALRFLRRHAPQVEDLSLEGADERLLLRARVRVAGLSTSVSAVLEEIRVKGGLVGFGLGQLRGPLGIGVPRFLVDLVARRLPVPVEVDRENGVVVVDLRGRLPLGLELEVRGVRLHGGNLEIALGPGRLVPPAPPAIEDLEASEPPPGV